MEVTALRPNRARDCYNRVPGGNTKKVSADSTVVERQVAKRKVSKE